MGCRTKILRTADAFYAWRREGPYRFIQNRPRTFLAALKSYGAAEKSKDQLLRDFWGCSIFDFCNTITSEADLSTQASVKADYEFTTQPKLGNGRGALERWPRKQALTIGRGAGTEQRGEVGLSHVVERIADRNVGERHPPRHQEVTTLQPLLE